jgi:RNA polymerase sigma-70 factor (ECF subfamily)
LSNEEVTLVVLVAIVLMIATFVCLLVRPSRRLDSVMGLGPLGGVPTGFAALSPRAVSMTASSSRRHQEVPAPKVGDLEIPWPVPDQVTALFKSPGHNNRRSAQAAVDAFMALVDDELRRLVRLEMGREGSEIVFHPVALVNEAALHFGDLQPIDYRAYFLTIAASVVRRVLVGIARTRASLDRADGGPQAASNEARVSGAWSADLIALDDALTALAAREARQSQIFELRFFGGLTIQDTSATICVAPAAIKREWLMARAALARELASLKQWAVGPPDRTPML